MKEVKEHNFMVPNWKPEIPISVTIDPVNFSQLLIYKKYCQVKIRQTLTMAITKEKCFIILNEMKNIKPSMKTVKSKVYGVRYTPAGMTIDHCKIVGKEGWDGLMAALTLYCNDGPYPDDNWYVKVTEDTQELSVRSKISIGILHTWWYIGKYYFGDSVQLKLVGPYENFHHDGDPKHLITGLIEGVETLINSDAREVKIELPELQYRNLNMRLFKQLIGDDVAVCISTDAISCNQRTLVFVSNESGNEFLRFLYKAKEIFIKK